MKMEKKDHQGDRSAILAHRSEDGREQSLEDHLYETARLAETFAESFGAGAWGTAAGLLHDDGKASPAFQKYIRGTPGHVDHSTPGAKFAALTLKDPPGAGKLIAYCVAGHHAGLPDGNSGEDETCLAKRLARAEMGAGFLSAELPENLEVLLFLTQPKIDLKRIGFSSAFFTRMVYSCLVDADFLDTECFLDPERSSKRGAYPDLPSLSNKLDTYLTALAFNAPDSKINQNRSRILEECRKGAALSPGLFSLTVPTGGGKTLSSLSFALRHAIEHGMKRVIYVIPYTNIIEQTATVFRKALGEEAVIEHHSNATTESLRTADEEQEERRLLATENWDAPIIVTTNVQFFESFFANRSSRTRKLHNVAESVVILDESQMLPVPFLRPTMEAIRELAAYYGTSVVLCTATQPALTANDDFKGGFERVRELMSNPERLECSFSRVKAERLGSVDDSKIRSLIENENQVLCILNTKKHARILFQAGNAKEGLFHLSAAMCPIHRSSKLGDPQNPSPGTIRARLKNGQPCRVVSTQLVEAGVDLDFPVVIRAMAGIDSIVQAAGRCNREGKIQSGGRLYVFTPEDGLPPGYFKQNAQIAELVLRNRENRILDAATVRAYFKELYWLKDANNGLDTEHILDDFARGAANGDFPFKSVAARYKLIPDAQIPVHIPYNEQAKELCERLRFHPFPGAILRRLQTYTVQVYPKQLAALIEAGFAEVVQEQYYLLTEFGMKEAYSDDFGLNPELKEFIDSEHLIV